ncbi:hypothetical protein A5886_000489 [Enterococcus sp. 8G7_MSG3316]|uniref:Uncharacterized protein n=1 Tax=Candidatus Enterococcus testudinis TaxID=1834191 RepID=A0A242A3C2_9ENTE|nr:hypothetical protein [Enterococcus sp. 8G7_MSG3316]OTN75419.1 hypothetical protein A5886_000489 [Enterococcus sp. 8G7_MSG3316]
MSVEALVVTLKAQQAQMEALQLELSHSQLMKNEQAQTFIYDLKDYLDSLAVVTDLVPKQETEGIVVEELASTLGEQQGTLHRLIQALKKIEEDGDRFFDASEGEIRRMYGSLQGILELNSLLLQENPAFQQVIKKAGGIQEDVSTEVEKTSFLQRLFKKK